MPKRNNFLVIILPNTTLILSEDPHISITLKDCISAMQVNSSEINNFLLEHGIKPTSNRILVARQLLNDNHPLSLGDLEMQLDPMDKASIFRVLELFASKNVVHVIEDGSRSVKYEICHGEGEHGVGDQHVHFYCEKCKETFCFSDVSVPEVTIPAGFNLRSVNYMLKGLCPKCCR